MRIVAVLDACVLVPAGLRDLLLSMADVGLFRPVWQEEIEDELLWSAEQADETRVSVDEEHSS